jgi:hypothetical protein
LKGIEEFNLEDCLAACWMGSWMWSLQQQQQQLAGK